MTAFLTSKTVAMLMATYLVAALGMTTALVYRTQISKNVDDDDDDDDDDSFDWETKDEIPAFPWEPKCDNNKTTPLYSFREKTTVNRHREKEEQQQKQELDILSSMTFANGGLRAPNCLCCR
jgi:hypothetical protein